MPDGAKAYILLPTCETANVAHSCMTFLLDYIFFSHSYYFLVLSLKFFSGFNKLYVGSNLAVYFFYKPLVLQHNVFWVY